MYPLIAKISTTVRNIVQLYGLRLGFLLGSRVAPQATLRWAARVFCTPLASSRSRALSAPTRQAREVAAQGPASCIEGEREQTVTLQLAPSNILADPLAG